MECRHAHGTQRVPNAMQLRDHLAKKFLGTTNEERDLATVAEMAIVAGAGLPLVFAQPLNFRGITPPSVSSGSNHIDCTSAQACYCINKPTGYFDTTTSSPVGPQFPHSA